MKEDITLVCLGVNAVRGVLDGKPHSILSAALLQALVRLGLLESQPEVGDKKEE